MMEKEVEGLQGAYCQMTGIWNSLKEHLKHEEAKRMVDMIDEENEGLTQTQKRQVQLIVPK